MKNWKVTSEILLLELRKRIFCVEMLRVIKTESKCFENFKFRGFYSYLLKRQYQHSRIAFKKRQCFVFGGTKKESWIVKYSNRESHHRQQLINLLRKWSWGMSKWYYNSRVLLVIAFLPQYPPHPPDLPPSDYYFFCSMLHGFTSLQFTKYKISRRKISRRLSPV